MSHIFTQIESRAQQASLKRLSTRLFSNKTDAKPQAAKPQTSTATTSNASGPKPLSEALATPEKKAPQFSLGKMIGYFGVAFASMLAGASVVHNILKPDLTLPPVTYEQAIGIKTPPSGHPHPVAPTDPIAATHLPEGAQHTTPK